MNAQAPDIPDDPQIRALADLGPQEVHKVHNLASALAKAIGEAKAVIKDKRNTFSNYDYASAEAVVAAAKDALSSNGLSIVPLSCLIDRGHQEVKANGREYQGPDSNAPILRRRFLILHARGESMESTYDLPIIARKGTPEDKAMLAAQTASLNYFLRDLLLLPRYDKDADIDSPAHEERSVLEELDQIKAKLSNLGGRVTASGAWAKGVNDRIQAIEKLMAPDQKPASRRHPSEAVADRQSQRQPSEAALAELIEVQPDKYRLRPEDVGVRLAQSKGHKVLGKPPTECVEWASIVAHWWLKASGKDTDDLGTVDERLVVLASDLTARRYVREIERMDPEADVVRRCLEERELDTKRLAALNVDILKWIRREVRASNQPLMDKLEDPETQDEAFTKLVITHRSGLMSHLESYVDAKSMKARLTRLCAVAEPPVPTSKIPSLRGVKRSNAPGRLTSAFEPEEIVRLDNAIEVDMIADTDPRKAEDDSE